MAQFSYTNPFAVQRELGARTNAATKTVPFDYAFEFKLEGRRGNKVQNVVEISTEGMYVALSVGYSLVVDEETTVRTVRAAIDQNSVFRSPSLVPLFLFSDGTYTLSKLFITGTPGAQITVVRVDAVPNVSVTAEITVTTPVPHIIFRSGVVGSDGTLILDEESPPTLSEYFVWDRTNNAFGQPFVSTTEDAGAPGTIVTPVFGPDPTFGPDIDSKKLPSAGDRDVYVYSAPVKNVDIALIREDGSPPEMKTSAVGSIKRFEDVEFAVGAAHFDPPLSPGDLLIARLPSMRPPMATVFRVPQERLLSSITLGELAAGLERSGADLTGGFRLNPDAAGLFSSDLPISQFTNDTLKTIFQTGCSAAEEVSFRYSMDVGNTGREYQNRPIHNIAGLGIANGDRPFRPFAKPILFEPRSFVRMQVEELSGPPGTLYIVLQGYKMLGTGRIPG